MVWKEEFENTSKTLFPLLIRSTQWLVIYKPQREELLLDKCSHGGRSQAKKVPSGGGRRRAVRIRLLFEQLRRRWFHARCDSFASGFILAIVQAGFRWTSAWDVFSHGAATHQVSIFWTGHEGSNVELNLIIQLDADVAGEGCPNTIKGSRNPTHRLLRLAA